jgi:hypothetical protein
MKMKKIIGLLTLIALSLPLLLACNSQNETSAEADLFTPLLRVSVESEKREETRLFYLEKSRGYCYLHPSEAGFVVGFVSPEESISSERLLEVNTPFSFAEVRENQKGSAILLSNAGVSHLMLKENTGSTTAFPQKISFEQAVFYDPLTLIAETEDLILLCPVDFKDSFVLAKKNALPQFSRILAVTDDGKKIWYAKGNGASFEGIAYFEYGKNTPLGEEAFAFDAVQRIGETALLFTRNLPDGGVLYLFRDLEKNTFSSLTVDQPFDGVTCDPAGKILCGTRSGAEKGTVFIYDLLSGEQLGSWTPEHGIPAPSLALSSDGTTLLVAVGMNTDEVIGTLSLTAMK